ncbi:MAG: SDR family NAD(P)-dependent oxidoreductase [Brevundimonas sp.]|uniref:SDR family oxidoreductase n=1 Tax=Brevundimonas sp. TaxID=1871086 RepID=UPI001852DA4B|nr:SDR family NAD(P)-dependent oxidoreductase [Brevundimonas sp.]MBA4804600.1 SDR family NAD(P)-dependent oxidoreductase [Brevundimonas sp.]
MKITGNTILITGGGGGIGRALAEALHAKGNRVIVTGRRAGPLQAVADANPGMAWATLDMTDAGAIRAFADQIARDWPDLNVLINNAGIMIHEDLNAEPFDLSTAEATVATNLLGPIRLTTALLPQLKRQPASTVMTVTSGLAFIPLVAAPTYNATKAALHSWTQSLRTQLEGASVEVLELAPPAVATDLMPGHAENPNSMPLADYTAEVMGLIERGETPRGEILVERVKPLRFAEIEGRYEQVYAMLNGGG